MNKITFAIIFCLVAFKSSSQSISAPPDVNGVGTVGNLKANYAVIQRDANSQVWRSEAQEQIAGGVVVTNVHQYTEIASGLNHLVDGQWVQSKEQIDILPDGSAAATNGQHQAYFPGDIYVGTIQLITPDGKQLVSRPLGLSYFDGTNSVLIAELTNSVGVVVGDNEVVYSNAFNGIKADLRYEYTRAGFEQDIILREQPATPEYFGLNPATARLQVLTEFLNSAQPSVVAASQLEQSGVALLDETLDFGALQMIQGHAFMFGDGPNDGGVSVGKDWEIINGRQILIEEVPVEAVVKDLLQLPTAPSTTVTTNTSSPLNIVSSKHLLPVQRLAQKDDHRLKVVKVASENRPGLVLDYQTVTSQANYTFQGDTTYFVSGTVNLSGTTIIEGGTVVKYTNDPSAILNITGTLTCKTAPYRLAIFTGQNDDSVGEQISGSTGTLIVPPSTTATGLKFTAAQTVSNIRFTGFNKAIDYEGNFGALLTMRDIQFMDDNVAVFSSTVIPPSVKGENILMAWVATALAANDQTVNLVNLTAYHVSTLATFTNAGSSSLAITNGIFVNSGGGISTTGAYNAFYASTSFGSPTISLPSNPFQTAGAGQCYLDPASLAVNAGTTNISSVLLSNLQQRTTFSPMVCSNLTVSGVINLTIQAQRDTDVPDLGYHYAPIDYSADNFWFTNATVTISPGTAIASYNDSGVIITDGSSISSVGTPKAPVWFTSYSAVQEQPLNLPNTSALPGNANFVNAYHATNAPTGSFHFTKFSVSAGGGYQLYHRSLNTAYSNLLVEDCEFWSGKNDFSGYNNSEATIKNNLFARSVIGGQASGVTNNFLIESNNLFWNGSVVVLPFGNSNSWTFFNNAFDHTTISLLSSQGTVNGYNAYIGDTNVTKPLNPPATTNIYLANFTYQSGWLGDFYQATNSSLINTGSVTADLVGLYHYTTTTNQFKETNSIVDVGYHYVAVNSSGIPVDTDGDGVPDYIADPNGNGIVDAGESDWAAATNAFPYGAGGYLYRFVTSEDLTNFYTEDFDDSTFTNGMAAFGTTNGTCPMYLNNPSIVKTLWPLTADLPLRRHFNVPTGTTNLTLGLALDGIAQIFINGILVTPTNVNQTFFYTNQPPGGILQQAWFETNWFMHGGCATRDSVVLDGISPSIWREGENLLAVRARDGAGEDLVDLRVSYLPARGTKVLASILSPTNGQFFVYSPTNIVLTGWASSSDAPISTVGFYAGNTWLGNATDSGSGMYTLLWTNVLAGTNTLTMRVTNSWSERGGSQPVTITNNTMPTVSIVTPTNLQLFFETTNVQLTAIASDAEDGTNVTVTFYTNNMSTGTAASHTIGATNTFTCNGMSANGHLTNAYQVVAVATDSHGASSASQIVVFRVAQTTTPPAVIIAYPTNTAVFSPGSDITISVTNNPANVTNVEFFVDGKSIGTDSGPTFQLTKCCWTPGTYSLAAVGQDNLGRFIASSNITIAISAETPSGSGFWDPEVSLFAPTFLEKQSLFSFDFAAGSDGKVYFGSSWNVYSTTNGTNWADMNTPEVLPQESPLGWHGVFADGTNLYAFGDPVIGSYSTNNGVYLWQNDEWRPIGNGFHTGGIDDISGVSAMTKVGGDLYAAGTFIFTGSGDDEGTNANSIARYDPVSNRWLPVGNGITNGVIKAMAAMGNQLYIGGTFTNAGGNTNANYIACLAGNVWTNVGSGVSSSDTNFGDLSSPVFALAACDNRLFVGGEFDIAGANTNIHGIAVWDGMQWKAMDGGPGTPPPGFLDYAPFHVFTISAHGSRVFVGGEFTNVFNGDISTAASGVAMATWNEEQQRWIWSDLDQGANGGDHSVQQSVIMNGNEPGEYDVYVAGGFSTVGSAEMVSSESHGFGLARWRVGYPHPPSAPTVTNVSPISPALYTNGVAPTNIFLVAHAHSSYTNFDIWNLHLYTNGVEVGSRLDNPAGTTDVTYTNEWDDPLPGLYLVDAVVMDDGGLVGRTAAPLIINVKSPSNSIVAVDDQYSIPEGTISVTLPVLTNDMPSSGLQITKITTLHNDLGTPSISHDGTSIIYRPALNAFGSNVFFYTISDGTTNSDSASVTVSILSAPTVTISTPIDSQRFITSSPPITLSGTAKDYDGAVTNVVLYTNGSVYQILTNGSFSTNWTASTAGFYTFVAIATDNDGLRGTSAPVTVVLTKTTVSSMPVAMISNLIDNAFDNLGVLTSGVPVINSGVFDLIGRASDPDGDPVAYAVELFRPEDWESISDNLSDIVQQVAPFADVTPGPLNAQGFHTNGAIGDLGNLDLTHIPDGVYDLVLRVRGGTDETDAVVRVRLQSDLKIGQFSFSEQDLVLPVNGIPLTVTRTYNSMNPDSGAFGTSWTFALNAMDVKLDDQREDVLIGTANAPYDDDGDTSDNHLPRVASVRTGGGWDVTLTLPDGKRTTFAFGYDGNWPELRTKWTAPAGITATLDPINDDDRYIEFGFSGLSVPVWKTSQTGEGYPAFDNQDFPGWILTTADGTKYKITRGFTNNVTYDADGSGSNVSARVYGPPQLSEIDQLSGDKIVIKDEGIFNYDPMNALTRWTLFEYDDSGRIKALHDPNGGSNGLPVVKYVYNNDTGNLIQVLKLVDRAAGTYTTNYYQYDNPAFPHYITGIINGSGVPVARNYYDDSGRLIEMDDANGNKTTFIHNLTNQTETVVDRLGRTNVAVYDTQGNVTATTNALNQVVLMAYDANNNKTNQVVFANGQPYATNNLTYDPATLLLTAATDPLGHTSSFAYNSFGQLTQSTDANTNSTSNFYDPSTGNFLGSSDALGEATTNFYSNGLLIGSRDAVSTLTTNFYDSLGNLTTSVAMSASGTILSSNVFSYDANANRTNSTVWRKVNGVWSSASTAYIFDAQNRIVQTIEADGSTNGVVYDVNGRQSSITDKLGRTTGYTYDFAGRLIQTTYPDNSTETFAYDAAGNRTNSVDRLGRTTTYVFDALNRLVQTIYPDSTSARTIYDDLGRVKFNVNANGITNAFGYDLDGHQIALTNGLGTAAQMVATFGFDANGNQIYSTNAAGAVTTNVFDALNRQVQVLYPDGTKVSSGFDAGGRHVADTNQDGIVTLFGYDGAGQLISVTNAAGRTEQTITRYDYDETGDLIHQIDALNRTNTFAYDSLGRRVLHVLPGGQSEGFTYDPVGNLIYQTNFNGAVITNQYDVMNRLTNRASVNGYHVSFGYSLTGQRTSMADASGTTSYTYDNHDRLTNKVVSWTSGPTLSLNYRFDANGNLTNLWSGTSGGVTNVYQVDPLNRLTNVLANGSTVASYAFDAVGNLQTMRYGNGVTNQFQYDRLNRLTNIVWKLNTSTLSSFYYQLGLAGNRTNLSETVNGTSRTYAWQYDNLYRLKQETLGGGTSGTLSYSFDPVGNRTNRTVTGLGLPNQALTFNTNDWLSTDQYDNNGNTTNSAGNFYQFDALNHLTNVNIGAVLITYNGDGYRVKKTVGSTTTYYLLDDQNPSGYVQVLEEWTSTGTPTLSRVYNYGYALISQRQPGVSTNYFVFDGHASTRVLADIAGNVVNAFAFDAYGNLIASNAAPQTVYLYGGQQFDPDLGHYYLRQRTYNPATGRFFTADKKDADWSDPRTLHRYIFGADDPVGNVDPDGESFFAFDGTSNWEGESEGGVPTPTNVRKLYLASNDPDAHYERGPGNKVEFHFLSKLNGDAFGYGMSRILRRAMQQLEADRKNGDKVVDIIGFSRGGVEAIEFANRVAETFGSDETIRFVGLFDPVGSVGHPGGFGKYRHDLPAGITKAVEAYANDENRSWFPGTAVGGATITGFRGAHSDIGGGFPDHGLSDVVLVWMAAQAQAANVSLDLNKEVQLTGIPIKPDPNGTIHHVGGVTSIFTRSDRRVLSSVGSYTINEYIGN